MDEMEREALAARLERDLRTHVVDAWFPRCVDRVAGGFLCDFDHRWEDVGPHHRMLEFQARQTRTAARLGQAYPADSAQWQQIVEHGLEYLRGAMHDPASGGWFWLMDRHAAPLHAGSKHAHGAAYLIGTLVEAYRLTGDADVLEEAKAAFEWFDAVFHDAEHGGYFGWATRDGAIIRRTADVPRSLDVTRDPLGHEIGLKDANVHSDLLDALRLLAAAAPDARVTARLSEVYDIVRERFATPSGAVHYLLHADLSAVPGVEHYGYGFQAGYRLLPAASLADRSEPEASDAERRMLDHATHWGWDTQRGGFIEAGPAAEPSRVTGVDLRVRKRPWWVQTEAGKLIVRRALQADPESARYAAVLNRLLGVLEREFIDARYRGWSGTPVGDVSLRMRLARSRPPKGNMWKDASHEADFYLDAIRMLRGLTAYQPIGKARD